MPPAPGSPASSSLASPLPHSNTNGASQSQSLVESAYDDELVLLKRCFICERSAPELLIYQDLLVANIKERLGYQEEVVAGLQTQEGCDLLGEIYDHELQRVQYLLKAYLRCRLAKIEKYFLHILDSDEEQEKLSPQEQKYAEGYFRLVAQHLKDVALRRLPEDFRQLTRQSAYSDGNDVKEAPDLDRHVFCRVLSDCGRVSMDDEGREVLPFNKDDLFVARYRPIKRLLDEGLLTLV